jgi:hypothetical protein
MILLSGLGSLTYSIVVSRVSDWSFACLAAGPEWPDAPAVALVVGWNVLVLAFWKYLPNIDFIEFLRTVLVANSWRSLFHFIVTTIFLFWIRLLEGSLIVGLHGRTVGQLAAWFIVHTLELIACIRFKPVEVAFRRYCTYIVYVSGYTQWIVALIIHVFASSDRPLKETHPAWNATLALAYLQLATLAVHIAMPVGSLLLSLWARIKASRQVSDVKVRKPIPFQKQDTSVADLDIALLDNSQDHEL